MSSETGEQPKEEKLSAETGPREGDKVTLEIQGQLVGDVKVVRFDNEAGIVIIQIGAKEPMSMAGDVFDTAYKQAQRKAERQADEG